MNLSGNLLIFSLRSITKNETKFTSKISRSTRKDADASQKKTEED